MSSRCGFKPSGRCGLGEGSSTLLAEFPLEIEWSLAEAADRPTGSAGCKSWQFFRVHHPKLRTHGLRFELRSPRLFLSEVGSTLRTKGTPLEKL